MVNHVIYHGGCVDGFTAAALLRQVYPYAVLHAARYQEAPPDVSGEVVIADFSYPPAVLTEIAARPNVDRVTMLDHHQTTRDQIAEQGMPEGVDVVLDMDRSGARITFDWLRDVRTADVALSGSGVAGWETLVDYVQDRDLWRFALDDSREVTAYINAAPMTLDRWAALAVEVRDEHDIVVRCGQAVLDRNRVLLDQMRETVAVAEIGGFPVPVTASPYGLGSDFAGEVAATSPHGIGGYYIDYPGFRQFGLRSTDTGPDVQAIARTFGGGGHVHASGFKIDRATGHPLLADFHAYGGGSGGGGGGVGGRTGSGVGGRTGSGGSSYANLT